VIVSLAQGLAATERAGWLGRSKASIERRWSVAIEAPLDGFGSAAAAAPRPARQRASRRG
jgi:hypothetical protein